MYTHCAHLFLDQQRYDCVCMLPKRSQYRDDREARYVADCGFSQHKAADAITCFTPTCFFILSVKSVLTARLSETDGGRLVSVLDLPGDVLIVPQATLGGRLKGKAMQYHNNVDKATGLQLYTEFTELCKSTVHCNPASKEKNCVVKCGTYGNRQVLQIDTNGPYTHILEF